MRLSQKPSANPDAASEDSKSKNSKSNNSAMKNALSASLNAETDTFQARLQRAESVMSSVEKKSTAEAAQETKSSTAATPRVVRDAFTMPESDYNLIAAIQARCLKKATHASKSEVLRAGLRVLAALSDAELLKIIEQGEKVPTGRPPNERPKTS